MGFSKGCVVGKSWKYGLKEKQTIIAYVYASTIQGREGHNQSSLAIFHPTSKNIFNMKMDTGSG